MHQDLRGRVREDDPGFPIQNSEQLYPALRRRSVRTELVVHLGEGTKVMANAALMRSAPARSLVHVPEALVVSRGPASGDAGAPGAAVVERLRGRTPQGLLAG